MLSALLSLKSKLLKTPLDEFHSAPYLRHNQRRLEHLASLRLPLSGQRVLEVGAGVGDHTSFFLDRGCTVLCTEGRKENLALLRSRFRDDPRVTVQLLDLEVSGLPEARPAPLGPVDIVYCYGVLYHLSDPAAALSYLARCTGRLLLLETSVSYGDGDAVNQVREDAALVSQAVSGQGCRPTRGFVLSRLRAAFPHVYTPLTQPCHEEFPLDWGAAPQAGLARAVFIASRAPLADNPLLTEELPQQQRRQD